MNRALDTVIVFLTYPGACLFHHLEQLTDEQSVRNAILHKHRAYTSTYIEGDLVSNYSIGQYDSNLPIRVMNK